jgi:hypothetical protein
MKKEKIVKLVVQTVAIAIGVLGLVWGILGLAFAVRGILESDLFGLYFMTPMLLSFGGILIIIAWRSIRNFGPRSIKNVVGLVVFSIYTALPKPQPPFKNLTWEICGILIPIIIGLLVYRVLSGRLIEMTETQSFEQDESTVKPSASSNE